MFTNTRPIAPLSPRPLAPRSWRNRRRINESTGRLIISTTTLQFFNAFLIFSTYANFSMCTVMTTYLEHPCGATVFSGRAHVGALNYRRFPSQLDLDSFADRLRSKHLCWQSTTRRTASRTALHNGVPTVVSIGPFVRSIRRID